MTIQEMLQGLGFTGKEVIVYMTVLQHAKISPADIARLTGINRATVYAVAKELQKKGMIGEEDDKTMYLVGLPPDRLAQMVERQQEEVNRQRHLMESAVAALEPLMKEARYAVPRMTFVDEAHVEQTLYERSEVWSKSMSERDGIWHGFQDHTFVELYEEWIDWYWKQPFAKGITLKTLTNDSAIERKMKQKKYERRLIKYWNQPSPFSASMWVIGDYILSSYTKMCPYYLIEIHDRMLAENLREVFKRQYEAA